MILTKGINNVNLMKPSHYIKILVVYFIIWWYCGSGVVGIANKGIPMAMTWFVRYV